MAQIQALTGMANPPMWMQALVGTSCLYAMDALSKRHLNRTVDKQSVAIDAEGIVLQCPCSAGSSITNAHTLTHEHTGDSNAAPGMPGSSTLPTPNASSWPQSSRCESCSRYVGSYCRTLA